MKSFSDLTWAHKVNILVLAEWYKIYLEIPFKLNGVDLLVCNQAFL